MFDINHPVESLFTKEVQNRLCGWEWSFIMYKNSSFEKYFSKEYHHKLNGVQWNSLLQRKPHFKEFFTNSIQEKLDGSDWRSLLFTRPEFKKYFKPEFQDKLSPIDWVLLVGRNNEFDDFFTLANQKKLHGSEWSKLLNFRPDLFSLVPENFKFVLSCGDEKRAIWIDVKEPNIIHIGCFSGTKEEAIRAISKKYQGEDRDNYIAKVEECFRFS